MKPQEQGQQRARDRNGSRRCLVVAAMLGAACLAHFPTTAMAQQDEAGPVELPAPVADPMAIVPADDPLIRHLNDTAPFDVFAQQVREAMRDFPTVDEAAAIIDEAEAARREAQMGLVPDVDLALSGRRSIARNFSNDPDNIIERSRATGRTDATFSVSQRIWDYGAASRRISAAGHRLDAARYEQVRRGDAAALEAISIWYDVFTMQTLVQFADSFVERQVELRDAVRARVNQGASAPGDLARVQSDIASGQARAATYRRRLANAEARYLEYFGVAAPASLERAPAVGSGLDTQEAARAAALQLPEVKIASAQLFAARQEAHAQRAETLPTIDARLEGGRFGLFENDGDYDIRGTIVLQKRFFGGADPRADQAEARADQRLARLEGVREEALRTAAVAWSDVQALEAQLAAIESAYISARQSRDVIYERFRATRGTLFDVLQAQESYFEIAALYLQTATELDAARYVLLSRTGQLLDVLGVEEYTANDLRISVP
ncbi:TolC family protein [Sphingomicrobium clamense]|uniref:TolC family protein n=1 Tax=Sphingomicrobium clamense TaxID=2851013 RepID=A0ABS6V3L3_9SPHN|nr:TolC family protein [Sphingomicrobium sp. B8]MBW0144147.1 TolC family protein [Sphingomicrobium sp. B8]